jgi:hypothetical protein
MFCHIKEEDKGRCMGCGYKIISEIISFLAVIFSIFVIVITVRKTKMNIINKLIVQILISEVLDGLNILLVIFDDYQGSRIFENYNSKTYICYSQIFLSLFTCLWTLSASFFISLRIYDIMVKKNKIFKNKIVEKYVLFLSFAIPLFFSYFFWLIQVYLQSKKIKDLSKEKYYQKHHSHDHIKHMYCWFQSEISITIFVIVVILIGANVFLSIIKGSSFVRKISVELKDNQEKYEEQDNRLQKKIDNMDHIQKSLWIYPIASGVLWALFFIIQIFFDSVTNSNVILSLLYCVIISVRQVIYVLIFLYTHKDIQTQLIKVLLCKNKQKKRYRDDKSIMNDIEKNKGLLMKPEEPKII